MEGTAVVLNIEEDDLMDLPPGFRFHPTDEEIITHYLTEKVMNSGFSAKAIGEVDMNKCEPWDLPKRAKMGEKEWFFFCQRDRKYPTGMRTNRATESGYWKATGKDKEIFKGKGCLVGMKKTLVFYKGRAPKGEKSNWVMHEYRLEGRFSYYNFPKGAKDEWVVCRVFHKNSGIRRDLPTADSFLDHILDSPSLPPLMDLPTSSTDRPGSSYTHEEDDQFKGASASSTRSDGKGNVSSYFSTSLNNSSKLQIHEESNFLLPTFNAAFKNSYQDNLSHNPLPNSIFCPQNSLPNPNCSGNYHQIQLQNYQPKNLGSIMNYLGSEFKTVDQANSSVSAANQGISDQDRQCKLEQFSSNNSMVSLSQDTALSNDINAEISSVIKREIGNNRSFEDLEGFPVNHSISDLDSLWDY